MGGPFRKRGGNSSFWAGRRPTPDGRPPWGGGLEEKGEQNVKRDQGSAGKDLL